MTTRILEWSAIVVVLTLILIMTAMIAHYCIQKSATTRSDLPEILVLRAELEFFAPCYEVIGAIDRRLTHSDLAITRSSQLQF